MSDGENIEIGDIPEGTQDGDIHPLSFTNFAKKDLLRRVNGKLRANWQSSFTAACQIDFPSEIAEGAVISIKEVGRCPSGKIIVQCDHN